MQGYDLLEVLMFNQFESKELSLESISSTLFDTHGIEISKQSLHERFNERTVMFFKQLVNDFIEKTLNESDFNLDIYKRFSKVKIKDSTSFQLPDVFKNIFPGSGGSASKSQIRIQFEYDLKRGEVCDLSLHAFNDQDQTNSNETIGQVETNDLIIRDLGYVNIPVLESIEKKEAFYLNRLPTNTNVYVKNDMGDFVPIDYFEIQKNLKKNDLSISEFEVYIGEQKFKSRLVLEVLPEEVYKERLRNATKQREKLNKKNIKKNKKRRQENLALIKAGQKPKKLLEVKGAFTMQEKALMKLNGYLTNIDSEDLSLKNVRTVYRMRWQVELIFKAWKQTAKIENIKKTKIERFLSFLYAKLLYILCNWLIYKSVFCEMWLNYRVVISVQKLYNRIKSIMDSYKVAIRQAVKNKPKALLDFITTLSDLNSKYLLEKKNQKISLEETMTIID